MISAILSIMCFAASWLMIFMVLKELESKKKNYVLIICGVIVMIFFATMAGIVSTRDYIFDISFSILIQ